MDSANLNPEMAEEKIKNYLISSCITKKELDITIETLFSEEKGLAKAWYSKEAEEFSNKYIKEYQDLTNEMIKHVLYTYNTVVNAYNYVASHCSKQSVKNSLDEYYQWNHDKTLELIKNYSDKKFNPNRLLNSNPETGNQEVDYDKIQYALHNFDILSIISIEMIKNLPNNIEVYNNPVVINSAYKTNMTKYVTKYNDLFNEMKEKLKEVLLSLENENV